MPITACCLVCSKTREIGPFEHIADTCSPECAKLFDDLKWRLQAGSTCAAEGLNPESKLGRRLIDEVRMTRYRAQRADYNAKASERQFELRQDEERRRARQWMKSRYFVGF
jgi:hypothetical protein